ncbi:hypothetical protein E8E14_002482 [Neopestalotiopsis sp. 37M]|nr:hypothetical protein E8E14_002482 [Neopestalotiopsis sp. 37M]
MDEARQEVAKSMYASLEARHAFGGTLRARHTVFVAEGPLDLLFGTLLGTVQGTLANLQAAKRSAADEGTIRSHYCFCNLNRNDSTLLFTETRHDDARPRTAAAAAPVTEEGEALTPG